MYTANYRHEESDMYREVHACTCIILCFYAHKYMEHIMTVCLHAKQIHIAIATSSCEP